MARAWQHLPLAYGRGQEPLSLKDVGGSDKRENQFALSLSSLVTRLRSVFVFLATHKGEHPTYASWTSSINQKAANKNGSGRPGRSDVKGTK